MGNPVSGASLKERIDDLYARYAETICDGRLMEWPEFFTEECLYKVTQRTNFDRGLPLGPMFAEKKGGLIDRARAIGGALVFAPRHLTYVIGTIRLIGATPGGWQSRSMFSAYHTLLEGDTELLMVGRSFDTLVDEAGTLKFKERVVVFDTERVPGALVYPV